MPSLPPDDVPGTLRCDPAVLLELAPAAGLEELLEDPVACAYDGGASAGVLFEAMSGCCEGFGRSRRGVQKSFKGVKEQS